MAALAQSHAERAEVEAVLRSGIFDRAPNVESFFRYVCDRYLAGESEKVKEYNIAVEALGRPPSFDQKRDSIVRVEAHRLRKRLGDYYAAEGLNHVIHIALPAGQYVPRFTANGLIDPPEEDRSPDVLETEMVPSGDVLPVVLPPGDPPVVAEPQLRGFRFLAYFLILLCAAGVIYLRWSRGHGASPPPEVWHGSWQPLESEVRLLAGSHSSPLLDRQGRTWSADRYYTGGTSLTVPSSKAYEGLPDPAFARTYREGNFRYDIPLVSGTYELRLYFMETHFGDGNAGGGAVNARMFHINLNGKPVLELFDALSEAGSPNRLHTRVFRDVSPAADGRLHLAFLPMSEAGAFLSAVEILPARPGQARSVRIVAQPKSVVDTRGTLWLADEYAIGGTQVVRAPVANEPDCVLLRGERYGSFAYHIPLAAGKYRLRLFFAETFFGTDLPYARNNPAGPRIFNVFANGTALIRNFDVAKEAGGSNKRLVKEFENLEPNAQGLLLLEFVPVHNYAEVNAIEVSQME